MRPLTTEEKRRRGRHGPAQRVDSRQRTYSRWRWARVILAVLIILNTAGWAGAADADGLVLRSEAAVLMEYSTGEVLVEKNPHRQLPPASITKMMVMLLVMEAVEAGEIKLSDVVVTTPEAARMGGSQIWLEPGEEMTVAELLKAVSIVSANDASYALAEHVAGSHELFVEMMNKRAQELGLANTRYANATGLEPDGGGEGNITTAYDMAVLGRELLKHPTILQWTGTWIDSLRGGESFLRNTNNLVRFYEGCDGLKTGYTDEAGYSLVGTAQRSNVRVIAVVMKAPTSAVRNSDITKLFNYGFSRFKALPVAKSGDPVGKIRVIKGETREVEVLVGKDLILVVKREEQGEPEVEITLPPHVKAPLARGEKVGEALVKMGGEVKARADLVAAADVAEVGFFRFLLQITRDFFGGFFGG
ncbi:MAG TPA: D-alanyl-D-alanine carboxypeptidase [Firmicutes bacterium]|jgi:D-alanyl-D-alanine carboxypeptidase (penicillin-binding protein 5/6)|nr:D-alanyl-D-alanine carboxypeptidase [Bacillota bacterium]